MAKDEDREPTAPVQEGGAAASGEFPDVEATSVDERFAENIRSYREQQGISQQELAQRMASKGWPYYAQTVHRIEAGRRKVSVGEASALAEALQVSVSQLTWPGPAAHAAAELRLSTRRAREAFDQVLEWTVELLDTRDYLNGRLQNVERDPCDLSQLSDRARDEFYDIRKRAADRVAMDPERAVAYGRDLHQKRQARGLDERMDEWEQVSRGGRRKLPRRVTRYVSSDDDAGVPQGDDVPRDPGEQVLRDPRK